jgi:hypothetical protein
MTRRIKITLTVALLVTPLIVAGCSSSPSSSSSSASGATVRTNPTTTTAQVIQAPTVTINGKTYDVPTDQGNPITPLNDTGQQIVYTSTGFLPYTLYSSLQTPVVWTNLSPKPLVLTLLHTGVAPVTIPVGGTYSWTPNVLDFGYAAQNGDAGIVNVGAFGQ